MDARQYLNEIVEPTIADYAADATSVRRSFLACVAAFHALDYLAEGKDKDAMRLGMRKESGSFRLIDRIAHAFKHTKSSGNLKAGDIIARPPATWDAAVWDLSRWDDAVGGVTVDSNRDVDLLTELNNTLTYLRDRLPGIEDDWLPIIRAWAAKDSRIASVHIFGSRAKGSHSYLSDLDLAVRLTGDDLGERDGYAMFKGPAWREELTAALPVRVDLKWATPETDERVWPAVLDHGIQVYPA